MMGDAGIGAVGGDVDGALQVGPPQGGSCPAVTVHNIGVRMTKYIEPSAGDDDVLGPHLPLGRFGDVPRQQHAERAGDGRRE